jgi:ATP-binding cassette subfamily B protein
MSLPKIMNKRKSNTEDVPEHIIDNINQELHSQIDIKLAVMGDITLDGQFSEIWVIVSKSRLIISTSGSTSGNIETYELDNIKKLTINNLATGGMLVGNINNEDIILCRYSNRYSKKFGWFCKNFSNIKENKKTQDIDDLIRLEDEKGEVDKRTISLRLLSYIWKYKGKAAIIFVLMLFSSILGLIRPYIEGQILFDQVFVKGSKYYGKLWMAISLIVLSQIGFLLVNIIHGRITAKISAEVVCDVKTEVFGAMQRLPMSFFVDNRTGSLMNRINNDSATIQNFLTNGLTHLVINSITFLGILVMIIKINWKLSIVILVPSLITILRTKKIVPKISKYFFQRFRKSSRLISFLNDSLMGIRVVKAFGKEKTEIKRFQTANSELAKIEAASAKYVHTVFPLFNLILSVSKLTVWGLGIWMIVSKEITFGMLISFTQYLGMFYGPLQFMVRVVEWWTDSTNAAHRIFEIMDLEAETRSTKAYLKPKDINGDIQFKEVTFSYEPNKPILHKIDMSINSGEMIGIAGQSGAGKSTIIKLLTKLYNIDEGKILVDGIPLDIIDDKFFKKYVAVVPQDSFMFSGTVKENITFSKPKATLEEIIRASKIANAHNFILELPDGYDTLLGRRGQDLSGGEKQRISIARAILKNPKILILDEATSSLDTETELRIQEAMERLIEGRTTISIAHRLSTLKDADRIIVIDEGRIVEEGEHQYLMEIGGNYYNMVELQRKALEIGG